MSRTAARMITERDIRGMADPLFVRPRGIGTCNQVVLTREGNTKMVEWTCTVCGHRNRHRWYGRDYHICSNCEQPTEIKGATEQVVTQV